MGGRILCLDTDDVCALLAAPCPVDPVGVAVEELLGRGSVCDGDLMRQGHLFVPGDAVGRAPCALPAVLLQACRAAALTTLAASCLLARGLVTVSLVGCDAAAHVHLLVLARGLPDVSHIAVHRPGQDADAPFDEVVTQTLERAGIAWNVVERAEDAVFGANLVVNVCPHGPGPWPGRLSPGAVVVNASGGELPPDDAVGDGVPLFVDDRRWAHRVPAGHRVEADLREVFTGRHPGRVRTRDVLRVELLTLARPDPVLAARFHDSALRHGRGVLRPAPALPEQPGPRARCVSCGCAGHPVAQTPP